MDRNLGEFRTGMMDGKGNLVLFEWKWILFSFSTREIFTDSFIIARASILIDSVEDDNEHARIFTGFTGFVCAASGGTGS